MAKRDPHDVLGVETGATPTEIKAAWRKLARRHHPDLIGDDPAASRVATRQMAEINEAYAALTRNGGSAGTGSRSWRGGPSAADGGATSGTATGSRRGGPPRPRPSRPVTARVDTTETFRPRNQPLRPPSGSRAPTLRHGPPLRMTVDEREAPRASTPTGPLNRCRVRNFRPAPGPPLAEAVNVELPFGKFHGHTLGEIAAFEPSYIDWLATTISRDRELIAAAKVVRDDLDRRGVVRRARTSAGQSGAGRSA